MPIRTPFRLLSLCCVAGMVCLGGVLIPRGGYAEPDKAKTPEFTDEQVEFYEKQVEPILKARCWKCHGGEQKIRGGLRLTSRGSLLKGGELGEVVSLEKPDGSLLLKAINYQGPEMPPSGKLPAAEIETLTQWVREGVPYSNERLADDSKPEHAEQSNEDAKNYWAYQPVGTPEIPAVHEKNWVRNPIDAFVLSILESAGVPHNPPAEAAELIRRVTYDLTGLPPTPEQVDEFVAAYNTPHGEAAYQRLIDRLLDSPQYGERWGRHWLDLVRYAETHGYERDSAKPFAWRYRDYVIDAFNKDKPYSDFIREQLAGDELDTVTTESLVATGYYRLGIWDDEPADRPLAKYDVFDGVVSTTGQVMLGISIGCARCHDHKKDPIPQKDYYRLLAFFRDITDMNVNNLRKVALEDDQRQMAEELTKRRRQEQTIHRRLQALRGEFADALAEKKGIQVRRRGADLADLKFKFYRDTWDRMPEFDGLKFEEQGDLPGGFISLAVASRPEAIGLVFEGSLQVPRDGEFKFKVQATEGVRLLVDGKPVFERRGKGKHRGEGTARLTAGAVPIRVEYFNTVAQPTLRISWSGPGVEERSLSEGGSASLVADARSGAQEWAYTTERPAGDWNKPAFDASGWKRGPSGFGRQGTPGGVVRTDWHTNDIWLRKSFKVTERPVRLALELHHDEDVEVFLNGERIHQAAGYLTAYTQVVLPVEVAGKVQIGDNVLAVHCHQTGGGQYIDAGLSEAPDAALLDTLLKEHGPALIGDKTAEIENLTRELAQLKEQKLPEPGIEVMCVEERGREPTHVLLRGNPQALGEQVQAAPPAVVCGSEPVTPQDRPKSQTSGKRLALADWITRGDNPLTSRVMVNRLWQHHFGKGIVPTPNEFGKLGELPTHPELLDWLARQFVDTGWRIKAMHRLIVSSNTYRMSSRGNEPGLSKDAANQLLWRFNMRRLSAEEVRDSILAATGTLRLKAGGPSVYPTIPQAVLAGQSVPGSGWGKSPEEEANRRSVYVHVKRSLLVPILSQYDQADTDSSCAVRYTTTVPTQALGMINGEFTNEQAALFASRLKREHPDNLRSQVARGLRLTTGRNPTDKEIDHDVRFIERLIAEQSQSPDAALKSYCLLLLGMNEFVYVD
ncbi:MAG: DUF1553 domain-containing protein [Planctomycetota bacterium]|nr:DUF1553 domain-containing protein [Planctomycetota bacterium]